MKRLILLTVALLAVSCSKDDDNSNEEKCYQVIDKRVISENGKNKYFLTLNNYGGKEVLEAEFKKVELYTDYCFGGAPKY